MKPFFVYLGMLVWGVLGDDTTGFGNASNSTQAPAGGSTAAALTTPSDVTNGAVTTASASPTTAANTTVVMACPTGFCHDTQFNPG
ncbi:hypothetical protein Pmar_PMAR027556, partial [Perkinsus marinus ATCC 50983]